MNDLAIDVAILGAAYFATHHASAADALAGVERPFTRPGYALLAGRARRFTSLVSQLHLEVCGALPAARGAPSVFATVHGEIATALELIADFRDSQVVSSARFALSVHNAPAGLAAAATGNAAPSTTITGDNAVAAGWLEAALQCLDRGGPVLLSIADEPVPAAFQGPAEPCGVAAAFLLAPGGGARLTIDPAAPAERPVTLLARAALGAPQTLVLGPLLVEGALTLRLGA